MFWLNILVLLSSLRLQTLSVFLKDLVMFNRTWRLSVVENKIFLHVSVDLVVVLTKMSILILKISDRIN